MELTPYTSPWWLDRLGKELDEREAVMRVLQAYYDGQQPLAMASDKFREAFGRYFIHWSDNFCKLVVQSLEERLTVQGLRFGDDTSNRKAWRIWQANDLDAQSQKAHREAFIKGDVAVIVAPPLRGDSMPIIRVQKPEEVVVAYGEDPLVRAVAMKRWQTPDKRWLATLYYPDRIEKYRAHMDTSQPIVLTSPNWEPRSVPGEDWPLMHDLGVVPVVPIVNDPDLDNRGSSEIAAIRPLQDVVNKLFVDLIVASEYASFRQRWATGMEIPNDPETGHPVEPFKPSVERIWSTAVTDAKFGDFEQTDVTGILKAIDTTIQHIASETRTPAHYLLGSAGVFPSGESLRAVETGLVAKARRRMRDFGEAWEEIERLGFRAIGDIARAEKTDAETIWKDPEYRTEAEHVDALVKLASINVPHEQLWSDAGYTPQQIEQFSAYLDARKPSGPGIGIAAPTLEPPTEEGTPAAVPGAPVQVPPQPQRKAA